VPAGDPSTRSRTPSLGMTGVLHETHVSLYDVASPNMTLCDVAPSVCSSARRNSDDPQDHRVGSHWMCSLTHQRPHLHRRRLGDHLPHRGRPQRRGGTGGAGSDPRARIHGSGLLGHARRQRAVHELRRGDRSHPAGRADVSLLPLVLFAHERASARDRRDHHEPAQGYSPCSAARPRAKPSG
jgi:hypothetical protein